MSGSISGLGTTYNLPNYTGILYQLTPSDTPFFSTIGGLSNGGQVQSTQFQWEAFDLRAAGQNVALEGATAPTAQERVRNNITNVTQIHQEAVSVSYSKLAAVGQKSGDNNALPNPVGNELDWQTTQMLKQMVRDVEFSFLRGVYNKPSDNSTTRKTRGLIPAIVTNNKGAAGAVVGTGIATANSGNTITKTTHGLSVGDQVYLTNQATTTSLPDGTYYVATVPSSSTFTVAATKITTPITIDADGTIDAYKAADASVDAINALLQQVYDNGGISQSDTAALIVGSAQQLKVTKAYGNAYGKYFETDRNVGGVSYRTLVTDFGTLNVMLNRYMPADKVVVCSLEECMPVYLEVPDKGHFFAEPLAKTGASDQVQLYGEVGLAYGNERSHGVLSGLTVS